MIETPFVLFSAYRPHDAEIEQNQQRAWMQAWIYSWRMIHKEERAMPELIDLGGES